MITPIFSPHSLLFSGFLLVTFLISLFIIYFIIIPLRKINAAKGERVDTYFFPVLGFIHLVKQTLKHKGDVMANTKEQFSISQRPKYLFSHVKSTPFIVLKDSQYIKEFLQRYTYYHKTQMIDSLKLLAGTGLVAAEDETWKRHRKIISSSFNFEFIKKTVDVIQNTSREFFSKLSSSEYKNYAVIDKIQEITGEIVGRIFFGEYFHNYSIEGKSLASQLTEIMSELAVNSKTALVIIFGAQIMKNPLFPQYRRLMRKISQVRRLCFTIIQDRKSRPQLKTNDLLSSLLLTQNSEDSTQQFSDEAIVNEFITFFIAGMDTTGHLIGMTLYNLTQYSEYLPQLQAERDRTYNTKDLDTNTLNEMDLLHAILKETLRFYTPAPLAFVRKAVFDHDLLDLKIKKGDLLVPDFMAAAFNEDNFENPSQFNPRRWFNANGKIVDSFAFTPFSGGPRNCIGQHLAIIEAKIIISEFLERFSFTLKEKYRLKMRFRFLYEPVDELMFSLGSRT